MTGKPRIIVGLSGGVDSAVAALLLKEQGYPVEALFMKNWDEDDEPGHCPAAEDLKDAEAVCRILDIRLHTVSFSTEYWDRVFTGFLKAYRAGRTPNPDVLCNREIKFRAFLDHAVKLGAQRIATGHYARIRQQDGSWRLLSGIDAGKDQSYFLHLLNQMQLAHSLFPLGELEKSRVRQLAADHGLPNYGKKDSTGICFIGERRFREFLSRYLPARPGEIRSLDDKVIGTHQGVAFYTLGQRHGLGIGGSVAGSGEPWYVADKDVARNVLYVVQGDHHPALFHNGMNTGPVHWIAGRAPQMPLHCRARVRYRQTAQPCRLDKAADGKVTVIFESPQRAVTPGQSAVFYQGDECLGGGLIDSIFNTGQAGNATAAAQANRRA